MVAIKVTGVDELKKPVSTQTIDKIIRFVDKLDRFSIYKLDNGNLRVVTTKATYYMSKHATLNIWQGVFQGRKVNVSLKKMVGELRYW